MKSDNAITIEHALAGMYVCMYGSILYVRYLEQSIGRTLELVNITLVRRRRP